jgi:hypothetical protein
MNIVDRPSKKTTESPAPSTPKSVLTFDAEKSIPTNSIVESIAACVDKYTGKSQKRDPSQKLTVRTSPTLTVATPKASSSLTSPRKRHLLEMREKEERESRQGRSSSPPPLLLPSAVSDRSPSCSESLPPPQLEKATTVVDDKSKKSPLRISVEKSGENNRNPPLLTLPSPPPLSPVHQVSMLLSFFLRQQ